MDRHGVGRQDSPPVRYERTRGRAPTRTYAEVRERNDACGRHCGNRGRLPWRAGGVYVSLTPAPNNVPTYLLDIVYRAHPAAITATTSFPVAMPEDEGHDKGLTGSVRSWVGVVCAWDPSSGLAKRCADRRKGCTDRPRLSPKQGVSGIVARSAGLVSMGLDGTVHLLPAEDDSEGGVPVFTGSVCHAGSALRGGGDHG